MKNIYEFSKENSFELSIRPICQIGSSIICTFVYNYACITNSAFVEKKESEIRKKKKPWPTRDAMEQIYKMNLWGSDTSKFYSGEGSHDPEVVDPYINVVSLFLRSFKTPLTVCDLGCGDFNVGIELVKHTKKYVAVDIVKDLIANHKEKFNEENLEFHCMDIAVDDLPFGDCAILRQVLQHLSNEEVQQILTKLTAFKYVLLTEHLPEGDFIANKDIISGQGTRLKKHSGLDILAPPFNFKIKNEKELVSIKLKDYKGVIVTTLYTISKNHNRKMVDSDSK